MKLPLSLGKFYGPHSDLTINNGYWIAIVGGCRGITYLYDVFFLPQCDGYIVIFFPHVFFLVCALLSLKVT